MTIPTPLWHLGFVLITLLTPVASQFPNATTHDTAFNSTFVLKQSQIDAAQLDPSLAANIEHIVRFDHSQLAFGGSLEDDFYTLPPLCNETSPLRPGKILKLQPFTDPAAYAIPTGSALSRIIYTTSTINGTIVPTSGLILWPYVPRALGSRAPLVVWMHGASGVFPTQNPSSHRALWYDNNALFPLVKEGFAVFAPDYAGLGVGHSWDGSEIHHQFLISPAAARDALHGLQAVQSTFEDKLTKDFVVVGHSQGGGAAWSVAELLAQPEFNDLAANHLGTVCAAPMTNVVTERPAFHLALMTLALENLLPGFRPERWLTPLGMARVQLAQQMQASLSVAAPLLWSTDEIFRPNWNSGWYGDVLSGLANAGRKRFHGPMLVIQGGNDGLVPLNTTVETVEETAASFPELDLELVVADGVGHTPVLPTTQSIWLQWVKQRFDGKALDRRGFVSTEVRSFLEGERYLTAGNSFLLWSGLPGWNHEVPLAA